MDNRNEILQRSLQLMKDGEWHKAHDLVDGLELIGAAHIHAYLHRVEGDKYNARYWYNRAGKNYPDLSISAEWDMLWDLYSLADNSPSS